MKSNFFETLFDSWALPEEKRLSSAGHNPVWYPAWYTDEKENHYLVSVELPGVGKDDVKIEVKDNVLTIAGERKEEGSETRFYRSFTLPRRIDLDKVEADCQNGILKISLPKTEAVKPRQIKIGHSKSKDIAA